MLKCAWDSYLRTICKLLEFNPAVAGCGVTCLQEMANSRPLTRCATHWADMVQCYEAMIRGVASLDKHAEATHIIMNGVMDSIGELLDPAMPTRALFEPPQTQRLSAGLDLFVAPRRRAAARPSTWTRAATATRRSASCRRWTCAC